MKQKLVIYFLLSILLLAFPINANANNDFNNELQIELVDIYEEENEIKVEVYFVNVSNRELRNINYFGIDVYDEDENYIETYEWENDEDLQQVKLQPGEFDYWEFTLSKEDINLEENIFGFNAEYEAMNPKFTTGIHVVINNESLNTDVSPAVIKGRTLVPLRAIFEQLGADVNFNQKTNTITAVKGDIKITHKIGENKLYVNGEKVLLDVSSQSIQNRTMVPLRAISESFNCFVTFGKADKAIIISVIE